MYNLMYNTQIIFILLNSTAIDSRETQQNRVYGSNKQRFKSLAISMNLSKYYETGPYMIHTW